MSEISVARPKINLIDVFISIFVSEIIEIITIVRISDFQKQIVRNF